MSSRLTRIFEFLFKIDRKERLKLLFLTASFFFIIAGYTIIKEIKDSIFITVVGLDYHPIARIISMIVLIPSIFFYSYLVDKLRRYQLLYFYCIVYGILGLVFAYFIGDPIIGISNTDSSPFRIFGWIFYFFVEGYSPFVVSVFWAFANSITNPEAAKKNYGLMVSGSKVGGMISSALAWYLLSCGPTGLCLTEIAKHQILLAISALSLLFVPMFIIFLMNKVPGQYLHGYEAVYKVEKQKSQSENEKMNLFSGLSMIIKQPYVLGIFSIIFFYEVINVVLGYQRLLLATGASQGISELNAILFKQQFTIHFFGFLLSFLGTNTLLRLLGERKCLLLIPLMIALLLLFFMINGTLGAINTVFICLRVLNYGINYPLRESLYIPTSKDIKFKSKSWIDTFGAKFAKGFSSSFNIVAKIALDNFGMFAFAALHYAFFGIIISFWFIAAYFLGKKYHRSITHNEVIGF